MSLCAPVYVSLQWWPQDFCDFIVWKSNVSREISLGSQGDIDTSIQTESRLYTDVLISPPSSLSSVSHLSSGFPWSLSCSLIPLSLVSYIVNGYWMAHYSILQTLSAAINSVWALLHTSAPPTQELALLLHLLLCAWEMRISWVQSGLYLYAFLCVCVCVFYCVCAINLVNPQPRTTEAATHSETLTITCTHSCTYKHCQMWLHSAVLIKGFPCLSKSG